MTSITAKENWGPWTAAVFCACLSGIVMPGIIASSSAWQPAFVCFLPMCFFFVGAMLAHLQTQIRDLKKHVAELQGDSGRRSQIRATD